MSSFYRAIQIDSELDSMEAIVYSRYISERMEKDGDSIVSAMMKQFGKSIDAVTLHEAEPLVWMIMQAKERLMVSDLITRGIKEEVRAAYSDELETRTPARYTSKNTLNKLKALIDARANRADMSTTRR